MGQYTEEELLAFRMKDKRMSLSGIVQALIQSGEFTKDELINFHWMSDLAKNYSNEVYRIAEEELNEEKKTVEVDCGNMWVEAAIELGCPVPTEQEQKVLDMVLEQTGVTLETTLKTIHGKFSKYLETEQWQLHTKSILMVRISQSILTPIRR
jgi:hypothetical protein